MSSTDVSLTEGLKKKANTAQTTFVDILSHPGQHNNLKNSFKVGNLTHLKKVEDVLPLIQSSAVILTSIQVIPTTPYPEGGGTI